MPTTQRTPTTKRPYRLSGPPGTTIELGAEDWILTNHFRVVVGRRFATWAAAAEAFGIKVEDMSRFARGQAPRTNRKLDRMLAACGATRDDLFHALDQAPAQAHEEAR